MKALKQLALGLVTLVALAMALVGVQVVPTLVVPPPPSPPAWPTTGPEALVRLALAFDPEAALGHVHELTAERYAGRRAGTEGACLAADYIAARFRQVGLQPAGDDGSYFQQFTLNYLDLAATPELALLNQDGSVSQAFRHHQDFRELVGGRAGAGTVRGELVYVGYAEAADLSRIDLRGRLVLCQPANTRQAIERAISRGAAAVLAVADEATIRRRGSYLPVGPGPAAPCLLVSAAAADRLLRAAGRSLDSASTVGQPFPTGVTVHVSVPLASNPHAQGRNVLGLWPGADPALADQVLILGAHYDHLGRDPDGTLYPGAIDNASGVAVLLEIARVWREQGYRPRLNVLFAAWDAEEAGLLGSAYYVAHPRYPLQQTRAMIQLDCVGGPDQRLAVTQDARNLHAALLDSAAQLGLTLGLMDYEGGSDHASFSNAGVPAVMLIGADVIPLIHVPTDTSAAVRAGPLHQAGVIVSLTLARLSSGAPFK